MGEAHCASPTTWAGLKGPWPKTGDGIHGSWTVAAGRFRQWPTARWVGAAARTTLACEELNLGQRGGWKLTRWARDGDGGQAVWNCWWGIGPAIDGDAGAVGEWRITRPVLVEVVAGPVDDRSGPSVVRSSWQLGGGTLGWCSMVALWGDAWWPAACGRGTARGRWWRTGMCHTWFFLPKPSTHRMNDPGSMVPHIWPKSVHK
jgi:hypothetical protein